MYVHKNNIYNLTQFRAHLRDHRLQTTLRLMVILSFIGIGYSVFALSSGSPPHDRYSFSTIAFSDSLKDSLKLRFPWQIDSTDTSHLKDSLKSIRPHYNSLEDSLRAMEDSLLAQRDSSAEKK